jgi:hypothetical protein
MGSQYIRQYGKITLKCRGLGPLLVVVLRFHGNELLSSVISVCEAPVMVILEKRSVTILLGGGVI